MNRGLAMVLVFWGAGTVLLGTMEVLVGDQRPGRLGGYFIGGPLLVALGFWLDRRGRPTSPPSRPRQAIRLPKYVSTVGALIAVAVAVVLLILAGGH